MPSPPESDRSSGAGGLQAEPSARRLAEHLGVDLASVTGTGPSGRILEADVLAVVRRQMVRPESDSNALAPTRTPAAQPASAPAPPRMDPTRREQAERLLTQANIQFRRGQSAEAEKAVLQVLEARPQDAGAHELLGDIRLSRGDFDGAQEALKAALKIQPGRPTAEAKLARAVLRRTEQQRVQTLGVAYAASDTALLKLGDGGRRGAGWAAVASAVLPGLGQFLQGQAVKGAILLALTILSLLLLAFVPGAGDTLGQLASSMAGGRHRAGASASALGWFVLLLMAGVWLYSVIDAVIAGRRQEV